MRSSDALRGFASKSQFICLSPPMAFDYLHLGKGDSYSRKFVGVDLTRGSMCGSQSMLRSTVVEWSVV